MSQDFEKQLVAKEAAKLVRSGMLIGIGSGSTSAFFIQALRNRIADEGLTVRLIATSKHSESLLYGLPLADESLDYEIDITFDGADRVDLKHFHLIKGGGGALLREKLVAKRSKRNIVLVDHTKLTTPLQGFPLPVEIVPFGYASTLERIRDAGYPHVTLRQGVFSDNHNYTADIHFSTPIHHPEEHHLRLKSLLGVIETGLFLDTATTLYIAHQNGTVEIKEKS